MLIYRFQISEKAQEDQSDFLREEITKSQVCRFSEEGKNTHIHITNEIRSKIKKATTDN